MIQSGQMHFVAIAGNPNTGKTTVFNRLTGSHGKVGNYPGVTVERHVGPLLLPDGRTVELMDVPGTYSLSARSEEEQLAIRAVAGLHPLERPDLVVCVVDATQLSRNLYLVLQLIELGAPVVVALNMVDLIEKDGGAVDAKILAAELGVPVVPVVGVTGWGLDQLRAAIQAVLDAPDTARPGWRWRPDAPLLVDDVRAVGEAIPENWHDGEEHRREALALWALLSVDDQDELDGVPDDLRNVVRGRRLQADTCTRGIDEEIIRGRYGWIDARVPRFLRVGPPRATRTDRIDYVLLHPALGFLIFLALMTLVFQSLFTGADPAITLIETAFGWLGDGIGTLLPAGILNDLLVEGIINGVGSVIVFLPQILLLFFFIGLMEDTGYMARVAYLMDRIMRSIGLHGRAFVPMLSGFACAVPAVLATRTMERKRDRLLTMMVVPLMTCSARLPVYGLLIAALYPVNEESPLAQGLLMVGMYLFSTVIALICAGVLGRTVLRGPQVPLLLEMPPYRMPHWGSVLRMMWERSRVFVQEAGTVILVCTVVMWFLLTFPRHPKLDVDYAGARIEAQAEAGTEADLATLLAALDTAERGERLQKSFGGRIGRAMEPALKPLGFDWEIGVGILGAFAAREVFVSTMAVVYGLDESEDQSSPTLRERVRAQRWPDGSKVFTPLACFSLMAFFALACQCMSTLAVVKRETQTWRWPAFLFTYMTVLAWLASFAIYQGGHLLGLG